MTTKEKQRIAEARAKEVWEMIPKRYRDRAILEVKSVLRRLRQEGVIE